MRTFFLSTLILLTQTAHAGTTYGQRLGWGPEDRVLILHIDDAGMSHESNVGAIRALQEGVANSVSVMMPCPWVGEFAAYLKEHPDVDAGLHLTHTSEWDLYRWGPLAGKGTVPGLVDPQGCLWDSVQSVIQNASPDEIEAEIRAQVERAETLGIHPTHLDSHMGTVFENPAFFERYAKVGIEKKIPVLMIGGINAEMETLIWNGGLPVIDYVHTDSYDWKTTDKTDLYIETIKNLKPGITEIIMHCTEPSPTIELITGGRTHLYGDLFAMIDPAVKKAVEDERIILTTWRELGERRKSAK